MVVFVLCKLVAGLEQKAVQQIKSIPGVKEVYPTFGSWDAIILTETDSLEKLSGIIIREIRSIHGVQTTETLVTTDM